MKPDLKPILYFIRERENIRIRRAQGKPFPWTTDPIFRDHRFCNVRREDDRVTIWIRKHIRETFIGHEHLWFMLCIARQLNWPPTLSALINSPSVNFPGTRERVEDSWPIWEDTFSLKKMAGVLRRIEQKGEKIFTGAYLLGGGNNTGLNKIDYICNNVLGPLWADRHLMEENLTNTPTLEGTHQGLMEHPGWGPFLAYQAVVDMRFTPLLEDAPDVYTYAAAGPGTRRGLNRIYGRPTRFMLDQKQALEEIRELWELTEKIRQQHPFDFSDIPNILCETDKYLRVLKGEGKMRSRFTPSPEPLEK